jgi:hypothetical protein
MMTRPSYVHPKDIRAEDHGLLAIGRRIVVTGGHHEGRAGMLTGYYGHARGFASTRAEILLDPLTEDFSG